MNWWQRNSARYQELLAEYGSVALGTYLGIAVVCYTAFVLAIQMGFDVDGTGSQAGTFVAAWVGLKVVQPIRIGATLLATPIIATLLRRRRQTES